MFIIGVVAVMSYGKEVDMRASPGETIQVAGYDFTMRGLREVEGPNYDAMEAEFEVRRDGELVTVLTPQKRVYRVRQSPMTEASIDAGWDRDLFVALGDSLGNGAWSVRIQYKPLIRWIWFGCGVMALGGIVAMTDRRYRVPASERRTMEAGAAAEGRAAT
jgi:cytochrome c-type biogenesis protein CcmF